MRLAISELQRLVALGHPDASFEIVEMDDPCGVGLNITVDVEDMFAVLDPLMDALYELQVEQGLPIYPIPLRAIERVIAEMDARPKRRFWGDRAVVGVRHAEDDAGART
ncbi:MAG TPA: hypothetical protein VMM78_17015 [Thermomicrobiales bacterium]|nr:hypothetical protein [Thermomicrobiales bacterium]